ncbi:MAG: hypothetical protein Q8876_09685 [Bacillota bacterium]|nr:hypothetical protein [Bacillota bacterium]
MIKDNLYKLIGLNAGIAILNIALFSPGLFNISLSGPSTFGTAVGLTTVLMSLCMFIYGNYKLIFSKGEKVQIDSITNAQECIAALKQEYGKQTFDNDITTLLEQVDRLTKKKEKIMEILLQKFSILSSGYDKYNWAILDVEMLFYNNIKSIINKIDAFDEEDYQKIREQNQTEKFSSGIMNSKASIYNEYTSFVKNAIEDNEKIIIKFDELLLEISKIDSMKEGEINNTNEIKQMDELIKKSKVNRS